MPIFAIAATALSLPLLLWCLVGMRPRPNTVKENLLRGLPDGVALPAPQARALAELAGRFSGAKTRAKLDRLHALAGRPAAWPVERIAVAKPVLAGAAALLGTLVLAGHWHPVLALLVVVVTVVAFFVPELLLHSRGQERQAKIALELPDTLDQMLIAVEAGLGFDSAMARTGANGKGPLAEELLRTLQDMQIGRSRRQAYEALGERTTVPDLKAFIRSVVQADIYGISISKVLRTQAGEMRLKRRQRAEEQAMKIPVKVIFPLMLFIMPVLFLALLGPAVLTVMKTM